MILNIFVMLRGRKEGAVKKLFSGLASEKVLNKYVKEYEVSDIYSIYRTVIPNKKP
ncbi:conserved hypothetical protein [Listeria monocytogenes]|nr:conserved hypothetical protein [Listeria monocytogenes]